ncbi:ATP-binding protein [Streptomyces sp. NPDC005209]|uniref:ATP-binding protein n=1 Tax=Streptomyces sp. NPDC005209 TaxID=3156715 RepID=UPI0033B14203
MGVPGTGAQVGLLGRDRELAALERALATTRAGGGAVLVLRGEAGIGKTALLDYAAGRAVGFRTAAIAGVESEMKLPFAGLQQLCTFTGTLGRLPDLPEPQRDALSVVFGPREGEAPNRYLVGLVALGLFAGAAEVQPLACLIDDAQWLDEESKAALVFVARRLMAERIALIFALREPDDHHELAGLPELIVDGLGESDARALLASALRVPLDPLVRGRIVAEAQGNPMALLQLPQAPAELAGGFWLPGGRPLASRIEDAFYQRVRSLSRDSRRLLLTSAAEPTGDACLLWRAAGLQQIPEDAAAPAEAAEVVEYGTRVRFHTPWCARPSIRGRPRRIAGRHTGHWRKPPIPTSILIAGRGTVLTPPPGPTRASPSTWNARPAGPKAGEEPPPQSRSSGGPRS